MSNQFQPLADGEVVSIDGTYRVSELTAQIRRKVADALSEWSSDQGVDGEALRFGSTAWQKGKVRLHLSIEFAPDDAAAAGAIPPIAVNVGHPAPPPSVVNAAAASSVNMQAGQAVAGAAVAASIGGAVAASAADQAAPIASTLEEDQFAFGTLSDVTGEIEMNLSDSTDDQNGYVDFDLSAAMLEINLDELVSQTDGTRATLIDEVWNEMSQPNWPGVSRT